MVAARDGAAAIRAIATAPSTTELFFSTSAGDPRLRLRDDLPCRFDGEPLDVRALSGLDRGRAGLGRPDLEGGDPVLVGLRGDRLLGARERDLHRRAGVDVADAHA